ncbi:ribonuclease H-like domain-containing protein [Tanacetum coccineum]|uniref:Ribonuclease H-like domain-containing protein n=1 Tax=Tanacetum coccineum TaxID=301880 RepID=A0ABQ5GP23_9ASTR
METKLHKPLLMQSCPFSNRNGNSFKPAAQTTTNADGTSTSLIPGPVIIEEKVQKKNDVKARKDLNLKFLRSLPSEWNTYVVVWRNKPDLDIMSFDDLNNDFKIVEQQVKGTASSSSQNIAFVSSSSSTNEVNTAYGVSTVNTQVSPASTQVSTASTQVSTANLSDDTVYAFLASRKIIINGSDTAGYDKSKVKCFNYHKMGYFARECRGPRNQDSRNRNQDSSRRTVNVEETYSKAMVAIDGAGFDWSYMADDEVPTNMALMAFSDSKFNKSEFNLATYKRGLASVEEQLVFYKKNEVIFCEQIAILKRDISYKDSEINMLKSELEKIKQEKESIQLKIKKFDNASKSLDKLIGSQITDNSRKGVGFVSYNAVPPPLTGLFSPLNLDLSNSSLEEFQQPEFEGYGPKTSKSVHLQKEDQGYVDSGCSRHITGNMSYFSDFKEFDEGYVTFRGGSKGGKITGKGTLKTGKLDFEDVYFVKELQFNLFSVSQMCDKKNSVLFTDTGCFVLSPDFKLADETVLSNLVLLMHFAQVQSYSAGYLRGNPALRFTQIE